MDHLLSLLILAVMAFLIHESAVNSCAPTFVPIPTAVQTGCTVHAHVGTLGFSLHQVDCNAEGNCTVANGLVGSVDLLCDHEMEVTFANKTHLCIPYKQTGAVLACIDNTASLTVKGAGGVIKLENITKLKCADCEDACKVRFLIESDASSGAPLTQLPLVQMKCEPEIEGFAFQSFGNFNLNLPVTLIPSPAPPTTPFQILFGTIAATVPVTLINSPGGIEFQKCHIPSGSTFVWACGETLLGFVNSEITPSIALANGQAFRCINGALTADGVDPFDINTLACTVPLVG